MKIKGINFFQYIFSTRKTKIILPYNEIHLWRIDTFFIYDDINKYQTYLSYDEKSRANRYLSLKKRERFVLIRGILRTILADYTGIHPHDIKFDYNSAGKPFLINSYTSNKNLINFNISHSDDQAILAIAYNRDIGIDFEYIKTIDNMNLIAKFYFSNDEYQIYNDLPLKVKVIAFYLFWTRKEACIKASGKDFSYLLKSFPELLKPKEKPCFLEHIYHKEEVSKWSFLQFMPSFQSIATLVYSRV